jgi:hypothetical protein
VCDLQDQNSAEEYGKDEGRPGIQIWKVEMEKWKLECVKKKSMKVPR